MTPATTWIQTVNSPEIYVFKNIFKKTFIYLFLAVLDLGCCVGFALVAASGGSSLVMLLKLLLVAAPPVAEHRF